MDAFQAIAKRFSCRRYADKPVPNSLLEKIVDAGRRAPTANNLQPVEFIVVTEPEMLRRIAGRTDYGQFIMDAPACIVVISRDVKYYLEDGSAAVENILIAATAAGLGACWVAGDKKAYAGELLKLLHVPEHYKLIALIPIGWPKSDRPPREKKPLSDVLHWQKFKVSE